MGKFRLSNKPSSRDFKNKGVQLKITRKNLPKGTHGEAISKNEVVIDKDIKPGSKFYKEVVAHEAHHAKEMKSGRIAYGKDWVRSDGKTYPRKDGHIKYNGQWLPDGDKSFPWEQRAEAAESKPFAYAAAGVGGTIYKRFKDRQREEDLREGGGDDGVDAYEPL